MNYYERLVPDRFYHIYNRGNNGDNLFYQRRNYHFFLRRYNQYLSRYLDTFAYCLLPNHFHLLVRVKPNDHENISKIISEQFRHFFTSFAKAIIKQEGRTGSLFEKKFRRIAVANEGHFHNLILYIHANPQLHRIYNNYREYEHSSFNTLNSTVPTKLCRQEVWEWFGSREAYEETHERYVNFKMDRRMFEDPDDL